MRSHAKTAFACLEQRLRQVVLEDVHYFFPLQLSRFFRVAKNVRLCYSPHIELEGHEVAGMGRLPPGLIGEDRFRGEQRSFFLDMSWTTLPGQVTRDWDIYLSISGKFQDTIGSATALAKVVKMLEHLDRQLVGKPNITTHIEPAETLSSPDIRLYRGE